MNVKDLKNEAINFVRDFFYFNGNSRTKAIIGISGGKDSSTVAALCCEALGKERVIGVLMPNGEQKDIEDSKKLCAFLGIENITVNIENAYNGLTDSIKASLNRNDVSYQYKTNTPARLRMATLYGIAAMIGNARISCNGNYSERVAGYFTLWGDGAGDFAPLAHLFVSEVISLGLELGVPEELMKKAPSDGMTGHTDEESLGFTYGELEKVVRHNIEDTELEGISPEKVRIIQAKIDECSWKRLGLNISSFLPSDRDLVKWY